jgi:hypothetical protein
MPSVTPAAVKVTINTNVFMASARNCRVGDLTVVTSRGQLLQQRLRLLQIARVEPLRKPPINRSQHARAAPCPGRARDAQGSWLRGVPRIWLAAGARLPHPVVPCPPDFVPAICFGSRAAPRPAWRSAQRSRVRRPRSFCPSGRAFPRWRSRRECPSHSRSFRRLPWRCDRRP